MYISVLLPTLTHIKSLQGGLCRYHMAQTLDAVESIQALKMALSDLKPESGIEPIHHSDREYNIAAMVM